MAALSRESMAPSVVGLTYVYEAMPEGEAVDTLTLIEADGRTTLTVLVQHQNQEHRDAHINSGMEVGMQEAMDHLGVQAQVGVVAAVSAGAHRIT